MANNDLIDQVVHDIETLPKSSATAAGQAEDDALVDTINQIFALFRINFHNQFYAAFNDTSLLNQAKRLWLDALRNYPVEYLLLGARQIIEQSEYLPTLQKMISCCDDQGSRIGLPTPRDAYLQACLAPHPKAAHNWRHPAVYFAGQKTGWFDLENHNEKTTWPIFKRHYEELRRKVLCGENLKIEVPPELPPPGKPQSKDERLKQMQALRSKLDL
ncbi:MAG: hypothetical protein KBT88_15370 [Gammaproteobacteria bacterium]|nr:hypothetical protein [Gammaproteobacteria bacterium]MBQ0841160.1 hypothetical protein [Gammaproteobacteria bacterium]